MPFIIIAFVATALVVAALLFLQTRSFIGLQDSAKRVQLTLETERHLVSLGRHVVDAETGERGFLLTGDTAYLKPYYTALRGIPEEIAALRRLAGADSARLPRIAMLEALAGAQTRGLGSTIALARSGHRDSALKIVQANVGGTVMRSLRTTLDAAFRLEGSENASRAAALNTAFWKRDAIAASLAALLVVMLISIAFGLRRLQRYRTLVTLCAWSKTVSYEGEWLTFEEYLAKRFGLETTHGVSPEALTALELQVEAHPTAPSVAAERAEGQRRGVSAPATTFDAESSDSRYQFLANAIPVQVWTATPEGALDYVSERTAEYFGRSPEQVIGDQWLSVLHPDDVPRVMETWLKSLSSGEPYEVEFRLKSASGGFRWHLGRATPQRDDVGNVIRWFGINTDIEDRKVAEAELQRLTREATDANRAKSDFLAAMSHELRTPLNAIGGYAQLIEMGLRGPVTEEQRADLLRIQRSKNHLDSLVSDVLNFAKAGAGRIEFRLGDVDVQKLLDSVLEMVAPQMIEKKLDLAPYLPATNLFVVADDDKMRQILLNLFANALKFTPADGLISIEITADESQVSISVGDTGIGIPGDQLERIFEPFVQAKQALKTSDQGVGLGLAISRQLARAMNGDLTVVSETGKGSRFTLTLPRSNN